MSRLKGIMSNGFGGVSSRSRAAPLLAPVSLDLLQLTRRGIVIELSINRTVNYSGLEAGVNRAKRYSECYRSRVVCDEVLILAKCVNIVRYSLAALAKGP
jgi:hypothetical protein